MPGPSEAWTDINISQWTSKTTFKADLVDAWRTNQEHLKEVAYGTGSGYTGGSAHTHDGTGSAALSPVDSCNLLISPFHFGDGYFRSSPWTKTFTVPSSGALWQYSPEGTAYGALINVHAYQIVGRTAARSLGLFGSNGCDLVASIFVRSHQYDNPIGTISFGFADGGTSFQSGYQADVAAATIGLQWKRFYARFSSVGSGHSTDVRFLIKITTSFSPGQVAIAGATLNQGTVLAPPCISNLEVRGAPNARFSGLGNITMMEQENAMFDAVDVTP